MRDSRGKTGFRDPAGSEATEEAREKIKEVRLKPSHPVTTANDPTSCGAAGKRVFSKDHLPLIKANKNVIPNNIS